MELVFYLHHHLDVAIIIKGDKYISCLNGSGLPKENLEYVLIEVKNHCFEHCSQNLRVTKVPSFVQKRFVNNYTYLKLVLYLHYYLNFAVIIKGNQ